MRLSKYQKNILRGERRHEQLHGKGMYVYQNNTSGDLFLPRPTKSGISRVALREEFQGDDYYMFMVRNNELRLIRVIEQPQAEQVLTEATEIPMEEKLITEQPPVVTNEGTVEFHTHKPEEKRQKLNENRPYQVPQPGDVLLNENPLEGIEII
jgi:hypothetical protein